jgi:hypothetical protein
MDTGKLIIDKPDFKVYDGIISHNGKEYHLKQCYEVIEGRWEGVVSMRPVKST